MTHAEKSPDWHFCRDGSPRGRIDAQRLRELWFHTGTACNLACPFCLEGSGPGDKRLDMIGFEDARPFIDEAVALGVERFSFTGGEPFVARQLVQILAYALKFRPCMVLSNGTTPLLRRLSQLEPLAGAEHPLSFRISIDYPDRLRHEVGRGAGTFAQALQSMERLIAMGFEVSVARLREPGEDAGAAEAAYQSLFRRHGLPKDLNIVSFPDFAPPGSDVQTPEISERCMTTYHNAESRARFMCSFSRMVVKQRGSMRVYACTLVDDDRDYDLGSTLRQSLAQRVRLRHHRCYSCFKLGASCSELDRSTSTGAVQ